MYLVYVLRDLEFSGSQVIPEVDTVVSITKAVVALHNCLILGRKFGETSNYCPQGYAEGGSRKADTLSNVASHKYSKVNGCLLSP